MLKVVKRVNARARHIRKKGKILAKIQGQYNYYVFCLLSANVVTLRVHTLQRSITNACKDCNTRINRIRKKKVCGQNYRECMGTKRDFSRLLHAVIVTSNDTCKHSDIRINRFRKDKISARKLRNWSHRNIDSPPPDIPRAFDSSLSAGVGWGGGREFETKWKGWRGGDLGKFAHFLFWGCPEAGLLKFNSRRPVHYSHYRVKTIEIFLPFFMDMFSVLLSWISSL